MPTTDVNISDMDSSSDSDTLDVANDAVASDANATSSDANGVTDEGTLSIVRNVVDETRTADTATASPAEGKEVNSQETDGGQPKKEQDNEDYSDVPFAKHPRFQELLRQRKELKVDADRYQNVQQFMDNNGISPEEAADGFIIMGLIKTDPAAAWEKMKPVVQQVLRAAGEVLPDDLQQLVQTGKMTQEAAFEVSRSRAQVSAVKTNQSFTEQQNERKRVQEHFVSLRNTAATWEADRRAKDPNFEAKFVPLQKELAFIQLREGKPNTPEGVRDQLKRAYESVSIPVPAAPAARPRTNVRPPASGSLPANARPTPETTLDIIRAARGRR